MLDHKSLMVPFLDYYIHLSNCRCQKLNGNGIQVQQSGFSMVSAVFQGSEMNHFGSALSAGLILYKHNPMLLFGLFFASKHTPLSLNPMKHLLKICCGRII